MPDFRGTDAESGHFQYTRSFTSESRNAFGRTMILASLYSSATGKNTVPGYDGQINGPYLKGIIRGTNPDDPAYWGPTEPYGAFGNQIAQAIMYCPEFYWTPLSSEQKKRLADWFAALVHSVGFECNCWYFNTGPVPVLEHYGYPYDYDYITEQMARILSWYSGSGFFIDGGNRAWDYYNFWGFQMFNLYHYRYTDPWRLKFGRQIRESTAAFMENFPYFFGSDGSPVPFGRSLTYRVAAVSPVGYAEAAGLGTLPPGLERRIASGCLKYFWERGMLSENGLVQVGWLGPNAIVGEDYAHRGSPYWVSVGFSPLLLPEDHPFWTEKELPMPADVADKVNVVPGAQMVFKINSRRGESRLYPIGSPRHNRISWQTGIKYYQHAYSSALGWAALKCAENSQSARGQVRNSITFSPRRLEPQPPVRRHGQLPAVDKQRAGSAENRGHFLHGCSTGRKDRAPGILGSQGPPRGGIMGQVRGCAESAGSVLAAQIHNTGAKKRGTVGSAPLCILVNFATARHASPSVMFRKL